MFNDVIFWRAKKRINYKKNTLINSNQFNIYKLKTFTLTHR